jgi:hypothetical protein
VDACVSAHSGRVGVEIDVGRGSASGGMREWNLGARGCRLCGGAGKVRGGFKRSMQQLVVVRVVGGVLRLVFSSSVFGGVGR